MSHGVWKSAVRLESDREGAMYRYLPRMGDRTLNHGCGPMTTRDAPPLRGAEAWLLGAAPLMRKFAKEQRPVRQVRSGLGRANTKPSGCGRTAVSNGPCQGYRLLPYQCASHAASKLTHHPHSQTSLGSDPRPTTFVLHARPSDQCLAPRTARTRIADSHSESTHTRIQSGTLVSLFRPRPPPLAAALLRLKISRKPSQLPGESRDGTG